MSNSLNNGDYRINQDAVVISEGNDLIVSRAFNINGIDYDVKIEDSNPALTDLSLCQVTAAKVKVAVQAYFKQVADQIGKDRFGIVEVAYHKGDSTAIIMNDRGYFAEGANVPLVLSDFAADAQEDSSFTKEYGMPKPFTINEATSYLYKSFLKMQKGVSASLGQSNFRARPTDPVRSSASGLPDPAIVVPIPNMGQAAAKSAVKRAAHRRVHSSPNSRSESQQGSPVPEKSSASPLPQSPNRKPISPVVEEILIPTGLPANPRANGEGLKIELTDEEAKNSTSSSVAVPTSNMEGLDSANPSPSNRSDVPHFVRISQDCRRLFASLWPRI